MWDRRPGVRTLVTRAASAGGQGRGPDRDPMGILDERFARGELDREEYEARKAVLRGGKP